MLSPWHISVHEAVTYDYFEWVSSSMIECRKERQAYLLQRLVNYFQFTIQWQSFSGFYNCIKWKSHKWIKEGRRKGEENNKKKNDWALKIFHNNSKRARTSSQLGQESCAAEPLQSSVFAKMKSRLLLANFACLISLVQEEGANPAKMKEFRRAPSVFFVSTEIFSNHQKYRKISLPRSDHGNSSLSYCTDRITRFACQVLREIFRCRASYTRRLCNDWSDNDVAFPSHQPSTFKKILVMMWLVNTVFTISFESFWRGIWITRSNQILLPHVFIGISLCMPPWRASWNASLTILMTNERERVSVVDTFVFRRILHKGDGLIDSVVCQKTVIDLCFISDWKSIRRKLNSISLSSDERKLPV